MLGLGAAWRVRHVVDRARLRRATRKREERHRMTEELRLSSPWVTLYHQIDALFGEDPAVTVEMREGDENVTIELYVEGATKAEAIERLLPGEVSFGDLAVQIVVKPANDGLRSVEALVGAAFAGNPALSYCKVVEGVFTNPVTYVVFRNTVVQYWNDNLGDVNGNVSTLYQDLAKELLGESLDGAMFCTDLPPVSL